MKPKIPRHLEVIVGPDGALRIDAIGYTGSTCGEATAFLEEALGTIAQRQRTADFYRSAPTTQRTKKQQKIQS